MSDERQGDAAAGRSVPCPECGQPSARDTYPFCSARCKDVDLNRWLSGAYAIPVRDDEDDDTGENPPAAPQSRKD